MLTQPREADEGLKILIEWYWHDPRTEALFARHAQPPTGKQKNDYRLKRSSQYFAKALRRLKTKKLVEVQKEGSETDRYQEAIDKLLLRSREGTERVKKIVQNLRAFSRMDQAELQDADLHEEIDRTLGLMEPRLKDGIQVVRNYGVLPKVRCYPGQLNQVFLNLLMNACDVLGSGGTITVKATRWPWLRKMTMKKAKITTM